MGEKPENPQETHMRPAWVTSEQDQTGITGVVTYWPTALPHVNFNYSDIMLPSNGTHELVIIQVLLSWEHRC